MYSFIVFKYVNLILWKENYILGRIGLYFWEFGEKLNNFKDLGSKGKYFQGAEALSFRDLGRLMHYFQGSREHRPPPPPPVGASLLRISNVSMIILRILVICQITVVGLLKVVLPCNDVFLVSTALFRGGGSPRQFPNSRCLYKRF